jgi:hypothetical protein
MSCQQTGKRVPKQGDIGMTEHEFTLCLIGAGEAAVGSGPNRTRLRYLFADALNALAREQQKAGRPDRAALLRSIEQKVRYAAGGMQAPSKRVLKKAARELKELQARLVDGESLSGR